MRGFVGGVRRIPFRVVLVVIVALLLFPFYWMVNSSLKSERQLQATPATFLPRDALTGRVRLSLDAFRGVLSSDAVVRGLLNSLVVAGTTTMAALAIGSFAAFALGKLRFAGRTPIL